MTTNVFSILPNNFFSVLASANKQHYSALLVLYYRLFQESAHGLERESVVKEFTVYLTQHRDSLADEIDEPEEDSESSSSVGEQELGFENIDTNANERSLASKFLRRFIKSGWLSEETLADYTKVINITAWGKPFIKALVDIDGGLKTEYESHVVTVYSMLCGETIKKEGHLAILKAHEEARSLLDSLKVLSQSIKSYYDNLNAEAVRSKASAVLHEHYNLYMGEVLDKAYKRLKTSDNVSRYRIAIFKKVAELLDDNIWLDESAGKYMRILQTSRDDCRNKLEAMLEEIRDDLRAVDPLEAEIDRRNAAYSRSSTEIIKAFIEPDSTIAGKIGILIKEIQKNEDVLSLIPHNLHRIRFLSPSTLLLHQKREEGNFIMTASQADHDALIQRENEFIEQMKKRLSVRKIGKWLDEQGGTEKILSSTEIVNDETSYIRFIYSLLYGDSRKNFIYNIEEDEKSTSVKTVDYVVPDVRLRRKS
jgi:hypothetical protein